MKKPLILVFTFSVISVCVILVAIVLFRSSIYVTPRERMQEDLAEKLGVRIEDYPNQTAFPVGYLNTILQPGMTMAEVHDIVQGYEKVLNCGGRSEIYYYFSSELEDAKRFKIHYDDQRKYSHIEGEEDDSRTLQTFGCQEGLLNK